MDFGTTWKTGDTIEMELDLISYALKYYKNGQFIGTAFENIECDKDTKYRMAVFVCNQNDNIILAEHCLYYDIKGQLQDALKCLNKCSTEATNIKDILNKYSNGSSENYTLDEIIQIGDEIKDGRSLLSNVVKQKCNEIDKLLSNSETALQKMLNPDTAMYKQWTLNQILLWICSLENGRFQQYYKLLEKEFRKDGITSDDLPDLTRQDLKTYGMNLFKDRKALENHFQALVKQ